MSEVGLAKQELDTPALWVDLDTLDENIAELARHFAAANVQWRPHMKGVRVPAIARKAIAAGAIGVTCATIREAEAMAKAGVKDILIANELVGARKIARLIQLRRIADVKVIVDCAENVSELSRAARTHDVKIGILIDINTGMNRSGIPPGPEALEVAKLVAQSDGLKFLGLMSWEGHALALEDPAEREREIKRAIGELISMAERLSVRGPTGLHRQRRRQRNLQHDTFYQGHERDTSGRRHFLRRHISELGRCDDSLPLCSCPRQQPTRA